MPIAPELDYSHALIAPGQGNQKVGMGEKLALLSPSAEAVWKEADRASGLRQGRNFTDLVRHGTLEELTLTENAQIAIIADSLARLADLKEEGLLDRPGWYTGLSLGFVSACVGAGSLSVEGAVQLGLGRGEAFRYAIDHSPKTTMLALSDIDHETLEELWQKYGLEVCLMNEDRQIVVGGELKSVADATSYLEERGLGENVYPLEVDAAFHSRYMEKAVPLYEKVVNDISIVVPTEGNLVGGATVTRLETPEQIRRELVMQLTHTDRWSQVMHFLREQGVNRMTELNETAKLTVMSRRMFEGVIQSVKSRRSDAEDLVIARRWLAPELIMVSGGSGESIAREDVAVWYLQIVSKRTGMEEEDLNGDTNFVDDANMDSEDLKWLRAQVRARWGRNVSDEEAKSILTVGQAIDATHKLVNS